MNSDIQTLGNTGIDRVSPSKTRLTDRMSKNEAMDKIATAIGTVSARQ